MRSPWTGVAVALALALAPSVGRAQPIPIPSATAPVPATASATVAPKPKPPPTTLPSVSAKAAPTAAPDAATPEPENTVEFGPPPPPAAEPEPTAAPAAAPSAAPTAEPSAAPTTSASAEPATSASARPAGSATPGASATAVRLYDTTLFTVLVGRGGLTAEQRATAASTAIRRTVDEGGSADVRVEPRGDAAIIFLGPRPLIELGPEDAAAAGEASTQAYATRIGAQVRDAISKEQSRNAALMTILSLALVVFSGLLAVFLIKKAGELADRARAWIAEHPDRVPAIRLRSIEVIRPASLRAGLLIGLSAGKALAQIGVAYGWVLITLSLFEPTRGYAERLTGFVFGPLYALLARLVGSLPLLIVAAIAAIALVVLVRFIGLFFDSVARGETILEWLPADLAAPTSLLVRSAVVLTFFVIAAPLVTGDDAGTLARAGTVALVALGLASTPLLSCAAVGVTVVYGRRLRVGSFAEIAGRSGRVRAITLLEVWLEDEHGGEVRVPHLLGLVHPTRVHGDKPLVTMEVVLAPSTAGQDDVRELLHEAAAAVGERPRVELLSFDADGARHRVMTYSDAPDARSRLYAMVAEALNAAGVALGRD